MHLTEEDHERFASILQGQLHQLQERLDHHAHERHEQIMATLAEILAEDNELQTEVDAIVTLLNQDTALIAQLQATIGSGNLPPDLQATADLIFSQVGSQRDQAIAALKADTPVVTPPASVPFVVKIQDETFADYQARLAAYNADPANVNNQVVAAAEADWDALPVG